MTFNQRDKNQLLSQLETAIKAVQAMPVTRDCLTCANYDYGAGKPICRAAGMAPPPDVVAVGCDAYIFDPTSPPF